MADLNTKTFMQVQTENAKKLREAKEKTYEVVTTPCGVPLPEPVTKSTPVIKPINSLEKTNG